MPVAMKARDAGLEAGLDLLREQQAHKVDAVLTFGNLSAQDGRIVVNGVEVVVNEDGVTDPNTSYLPTHIGDESIASRLDIPARYMRRLRVAENLPLWDQTMNHWFRSDPNRKVLVRMFRPSHGEADGVLRSMSSDKFKMMDHLDTILSVLNGLREAGIEFRVDSLNVDERRLTLKVSAPTIRVAAETLLKGYRSPFTGLPAADNPFIFAGFAFTNSETGFGSLSMGPSATVEICSNGMRRNIDLFRAVHLGSRMDEGVVQWTGDTQEKALRLVTAQVRDAAQQFCSEDYLREWVSSLEERAGVQVTDPARTVKVIAKRSGFTEAEAQGILSHFISGGQATAGGFMQATTSFAQTIKEPGRAMEVEEKAEFVLDVAASAR